MKDTRITMGMPVTVEILDTDLDCQAVDIVFDYFNVIDNRFSPFKETSEVTMVNKGLIKETDYSEDLKEIIKSCLKTKEETFGYFDLYVNGKFNPTGLVKGWAIYNAYKLLRKRRVKNFFIDAGGDIQVSGLNIEGNDWRVGIRNPFNENEVIKVLKIRDKGVATSGTYVRGNHIYNPHTNFNQFDIVSLTVIGDNVYEADRFATAAFAMGKKGIDFIESKNNLEGYMVDKNKKAYFTSNFNNYVLT